MKYPLVLMWILIGVFNVVIGFLGVDWASLISWGAAGFCFWCGYDSYKKEKRHQEIRKTFDERIAEIMKGRG